MEFNDEFAAPADYARLYREKGWTVVPALLPGEGKQGQWKRPAVGWKQYQDGVPDDVWQNWYGENGQYVARPNLGILTGKRLFVLDLDLYKTPAAAQWWQAVLGLHNNGFDLETVTQRTGGGGLQMVFRAPLGWTPPTFRSAIGIDVRGMGGFAMLPPSRHESGSQYEWREGLSPADIDPVEAPAWLCAEIDKVLEQSGGAAQQATGSVPVVKTPTPITDINPLTQRARDGRETIMYRHVFGCLVNLYRECPDRPDATETEAHIAQAYRAYSRKVAPRGGHGPISSDEALEREGRGLTAYSAKFHEALKHWDTKIAEHAKMPPPQRQDGVRYDPETGEVFEAKTRTVKAEKVTVIPPAKEDAGEADGEEAVPVERGGFLTTQKGTIIGCLYNAAMAIRTDEKFSGRIKKDLLSGRILFQQGNVEKVIQDNDVSEIACYLQATYTPTFSLPTVHEAVSAIASENAFDPLKDYLEGLEWDGVERISTWLEDLCGAVVETENQRRFVSAVGRAWLISAIARGLQPASKADGVLILQGPQGIGKSTVARILGGPWYTDEMPNLASKEAALQLYGNWIIELGELAAMSRSDLESTKGFITRTIDKFRPPYGRIVIEQPRRCVFIGTTNSLTFLKDESGNRRFWPVECTGIDTENLESLRDQLFAEALVAFRAGERWWLNEEILKIAVEEQEARTDNDDEMAGEVLSIANLKPDGICIAEIMKRMGLERPQPRPIHLRIGAILRKHGWVIRGQTKIKDGFGLQKRYVQTRVEGEE